MRGNIPKRPCGVGGANSFATRSLWQPLRDEETEESSYFFYISKEELSESIDSLISICVYQEKHQSNHKDELVESGLMCTYGHWFG